MTWTVHGMTWRSDRGNLADHHVCRRRRAAAGVLQAPQRSPEPPRVDRRATALAGAALAALALGGSACASSQPATFASRFIIPGQPSVDLGGGPAPAATPSVPAPLPEVSRPPRTSSSLPTLESTSATLQRRLAALAARPSPQAYLDVAAAYRDFGVEDRGFDYLARGLAAFPTAATLHEATARQWRDWGLPGHALRHAHLAVRYAPDSPTSHTTLGTVLWALSARAAATDAFLRAVDLAPEAAFARHNLCLAERELGRPARPACTAAVTPGPGASDR